MLSWGVCVLLSAAPRPGSRTPARSTRWPGLNADFRVIQLAVAAGRGRDRFRLTALTATPPGWCRSWSLSRGAGPRSCGGYALPGERPSPASRWGGASPRPCTWPWARRWACRRRRRSPTGSPDLRVSVPGLSPGRPAGSGASSSSPAATRAGQRDRAVGLRAQLIRRPDAGRAVAVRPVPELQGRGCSSSTACSRSSARPYLHTLMAGPRRGAGPRRDRGGAVRTQPGMRPWSPTCPTALVLSEEQAGADLHDGHSGRDACGRYCGCAKSRPGPRGPGRPDPDPRVPAGASASVTSATRPPRPRRAAWTATWRRRWAPMTMRAGAERTAAAAARVLDAGTARGALVHLQRSALDPVTVAAIKQPKDLLLRAAGPPWRPAHRGAQAR